MVEDPYWCAGLLGRSGISDFGAIAFDFDLFQALTLGARGEDSADECGGNEEADENQTVNEQAVGLHQDDWEDEGNRATGHAHNEEDDALRARAVWGGEQFR